MFVKIRYFNVKKAEDKTIIYNDVEHEEMHEAKMVDLETIPPNEGESLGKMHLVLDGDTPNRKDIYVPWEQDNKVVEIYYMNNEGKTIDRYVY